MSPLNIEYANDITGWEDWQFEYLYGAFYIFPPAEVSEPINNLRKKFDPRSDSYCQAHISLSEPLNKPVTGETLAEISEKVREFAPIEMTYGPVRTFPPHPGVCFAVAPEHWFFELRELLHSCSAFTGNSFTRKAIAPHITIAEFGLTYEASEELRQQLECAVAVGTFFCDSIVLAVPNERFYFEPKLTIPFGT